MQTKKCGIQVAVLYLCIGVASTCPAKVIYVDADATGANDGSSWTDAYNYLQDTLTDASSSQKPVEIRVAQGLYRPDRGTGITPGDREATFGLINGVTLSGGYAGFGQADPNVRDINVYETILSGDLAGDDGPNFANRSENSYHVVTGSSTDANAVLDGFSITAGNAEKSYPSPHRYGGGMYNRSGSPTVTNCTFRANSAGWGGGMYSKTHTGATVSNCTFTRNRAVLGGGMHNDNHSAPTLTNCLFRDNRADSGGGVYNMTSSRPMLRNCVFSGNRAGDAGGGMYNNNSSRPTFTNCLFSGNVAGEDGGGMGSYNHCTATLTNCTFTDNSAETGGGMHIRSSSSAVLTNCIFWGNQAPSRPEIYLKTGGISMNYTDIRGNWPGYGNIDADPMFVARGYWDDNGTPANQDDDFWVEGDYHLQPGSPCIDTGNDAGVYADIEGNTRPVDGDNDSIAVGDMGAYERAVLDGPAIKISPVYVRFDAYDGESVSHEHIFKVRNIGIDTLNWQIGGGCSWLKVSPSSGESTGETDEVTLTLDTSGLTYGIHECTLSVRDSNAMNSPRNVTAKLYFGDALKVPAEYGTIQAAIDAANDTDTVIVADGNYTGNGNRDIVFRGKAIRVKSENGPAGCIIDCRGSEEEPHRGFDFVNGEDSNSILDGFTIKNGFAPEGPDDSGGAIRCYQSDPTINNCIVTGNSANEGGGIFCEDSQGPVISNCVVTDNKAQYGGGICCFESSPSISNCTIGGNEGKYGGGIFADKDRTTVNACIIIANTYEGDFNPSQVHGGGGVFCHDSEMRMTNTIIVGNSTNGLGGGVLFENGAQAVINCTISGNSAYIGGGISGSFGGHVIVLNSILWGDQAEHYNEIFMMTITSVSKAIVGYSDVQGGWLSGIGNIGSDPFFVDADNGDYRLLPGSKCIDAGANAGVYADIADNVRPIDFPGVDNNGELPDFDMGAYEAVVRSRADLRMVPRVINRCSRRQRIIAIVRLPEGVSEEQIDKDRPLLLYPGGIEAISQYVSERDDEGAVIVRILAFFDKALLMDAAPDNGQTQLRVFGELKTGEYFSGADTVRIIGPCGRTIHFGRFAEFSRQWLRSGPGLEADVDNNGCVDFTDFARTILR